MDFSHSTIFQKNSQKIIVKPSQIQKVTTRPGVYLYYNNEETVLYVGKAKNLKNRVGQYFTHDLAVGTKTNLLVSQIAFIKILPTDSELDALLLEATLIRRYLPKYNAIAKDDKSPLYIVITLDEELPRIMFTRKNTIDSWDAIPKRRFVIGPFQSSRVAHRLMRSVRAVIPYCTQKQRTGAACFYTHIGLCKPCPSFIHTMPQSPQKQKLISDYRRNLEHITLVLSGGASRVRRDLEKSMQTRAGCLDYEGAGEIKRQLDVLDMLLTHAFDPSLYTDRASQPDHVYETRLFQLAAVLTKAGLPIRTLNRIECIDISTLQGAWSTGSLVVFTDGIPDTDQYRRFRIKSGGQPNDVGMMTEVIARRFGHSEWPYPDLLVVDGGKPQVTAALNALAGILSEGMRRPARPEVKGSLSIPIPVIGLAKRYEQIIIALPDMFQTIRLPPTSPALQLIQHMRDEAHRFAKRYHITLRNLVGL